MRLVFGFVVLLISAEAQQLQHATQLSSEISDAVVLLQTQDSYTERVAAIGSAMAVFAGLFLPFAFSKKSHKLDCSCAKPWWLKAKSVFSGHVKVPFVGCAPHLGGGKYLCYVTDGSACIGPKTYASTQFIGAALKECDPDVEEEEGPRSQPWAAYFPAVVMFATIIPMGLMQAQLSGKAALSSTADDSHLAALRSTEWQCVGGTSCNNFNSFVLPQGTGIPTLPFAACTNRFSRLVPALSRNDVSTFQRSTFQLQFQCDIGCVCPTFTDWTPIHMDGTVGNFLGGPAPVWDPISSQLTANGSVIVVVDVADKSGAYSSSMRIYLGSQMAFAGGNQVTNSPLFAGLDSRGRFAFTTAVYPQSNNHPLLRISVTSSPTVFRQYLFYAPNSFRGVDLLA